MTDEPLSTLTEEFDAAFRDLASARAAYEDQPRDPDLIAALSAARERLDDARAAMDAERQRRGLKPPWKVQPAKVDRTKPPPRWSVDHGPNA